MRALHYIELKKIYSYLEALKNLYIDKIYKHNDKKYIFVFRAKGIKKYLLIFVGKALYFVNDFNRGKDNFSEKLQDFLRRKKLLDIKIIKGNRIVEMNFGRSKLYIELFNPGNIILVDESNSIIEAYLYKDFGIRKIFRGEKYEIPPSNNIDPFETSLETFREIILNSNRKDIIRTLILDLNIGKTYAEEVIFRSGISKDEKPSKLSEDKIRKLYNKMKEVLNENRYFLYQNDFSFCELKHLNEKGREFNNPNDLLIEVYEKISLKEDEKNKRILEIIKKEIDEMDKVISLLNENKYILKYIYDALASGKEPELIIKEVKEYFGIPIDIQRIDKYKFKIKFLS